MKFKTLDIPVISVVNGIAAAAGLQLIASTDLVIAT
jgi:enoyl-CoA hydratase/carnithine racemase